MVRTPVFAALGSLLAVAMASPTSLFAYRLRTPTSQAPAQFEVASVNKRASGRAKDLLDLELLGH